MMNKKETFMMFLKDEIGAPIFIIGPYYAAQKEAILQQNPACDIEHLEVLSEHNFAIKYPLEYSSHLSVFWMDKVITYLHDHEEWVGDFQYDFEEEVIHSNWFTITPTINDETDQIGLGISFTHNANAFYVARMKIDFQELFFMEVVQFDDYYHCTEGILTGEQGLRRYLAESLITAYEHLS